MTTAAQQHQQLQNQLAAETFDPDEVIPRDSPLMKALHPKLELSPSPPPDIPAAQVSLEPPPIDGFPRSNRPKIRPRSGDAVLVALLDNGRRPEIARAAGYRALPGVDEEEEDSPLGGCPSRFSASLYTKGNARHRIVNPPIVNKRRPSTQFYLSSVNHVQQRKQISCYHAHAG
ncbi:hypothetical protein ED733_005765 [Metarhizium rileyi]|uniref:Uncharacterized protein n=1 Tax=Metarhizium rileyi (strain RCEF 4871) TaxID=1649241 RepID=A0A5C6GFT7_METRR|nr:hypothetical protein ED733_005765 [Metarhizium rileyi]